PHPPSPPTRAASPRPPRPPPGSPRPRPAPPPAAGETPPARYPYEPRARHTAPRPPPTAPARRPNRPPAPGMKTLVPTLTRDVAAAAVARATVTSSVGAPR